MWPMQIEWSSENLAVFLRHSVSLSNVSWYKSKSMTIFEKHFWVVHFMLAQLESLVSDTVLAGTLIPLDEDDDADLLLIASSD